MKRRLRMASRSAAPASRPRSMLMTVGMPMAMVGRQSRIQSKKRDCENRRANIRVAPATSAGCRHSMWDEAQLKDRYSSMRSASVSFHMSMVWSAIQK